MKMPIIMFFGLFVSQVAFIDMSIASNQCSNLFEESPLISNNNTTFKNQILAKIILLGQHEQFLFDHVMEWDRDKPRIEKESKELQKEIIEIVENNVFVTDILIEIIGNRFYEFRTRRQAALMLKYGNFSDVQLDRFETEILNVYNKSELFTDNQVILNKYRRDLNKLNENDPHKKLRPLLGQDIGTNTKLYGAFMEGYIGAIINSSVKTFEHRSQFILGMLRYSIVDFAASKDPRYTSSVVQFTLANITLVTDLIKLEISKKIINQIILENPNINKENLFWTINHIRKNHNLSPIDLTTGPSPRITRATLTIIDGGKK